MEKKFINNWKRYLAEQNEPVDDGRADLIEVLTGYLNKMKTGPFEATGVAQTIYNVCANWMNKVDGMGDDKFANRPGKPMQTKAAYAPEVAEE